MKHTLLAAAVALAFAVPVGAQTTPGSQPQPQTPSTSTPSETHHKRSGADKTGSSAMSNVTLTGCLRQGATPDTFELDNVQMTSPDTSSMHEPHPGTAGEPGASTPPSSTSTSTTGSRTSGGMSSGMMSGDMGPVTLLANADIDLKAHVGHKVEVRGPMTMIGQGKGKMSKDKSSSSTADTMGSPSSASSSSATGTSGSQAEAKSAHALRVRAFRPVADTCSQ